MSTQIARRCLCAILVLCITCIPAFAAEAPPADSQPPVMIQNRLTEVPIYQNEANINGRQVLTKVFEVSPDTDPETLKETGLVIDGFEYTLSSFTKETTTKEDTKTESETKTISLKSSNQNDAYLEALKTFSQTIEYNQDGYEGTLNLVAASIEVSETGRSSHKASDVKTKTYTFDYNDDSLIPGTINVGGKTYTKSSVSWSDGAYGADGVMPENYVATVRYGRSWSYSSVDGYQATAEYTGTVNSKNNELVKYTVEYIGQPVQGSGNQSRGLFGGSADSSNGRSGVSAGTCLVVILLVAGACFVTYMFSTGKVKLDMSAKSAKGKGASSDSEDA